MAVVCVYCAANNVFSMLSPQLGKALRIESYILSPESTHTLYPLMNVKDIYATLYSPADGTIDPAGYCTALTRVARQRGAKVSIAAFYGSLFYLCSVE